MTFENWFEIATKSIAEIEKAKIRNELEAHVFEAVQAHHSNGMSTLEAEEQAVLELGDPKIAARGFAREYLTTVEARRVGLEIVRIPQWVKWVGTIFLITTVCIFIMFPVWISSTYPTMVTAFTAFVRMELAGGAALLLGGWLDQRMFARRAPIRTLMGVTLFGRMLVLIFLANWSYAMPYPFQLPAWLAVGFGILCMTGWYFTDFSTLRKLRARA